MNRKIKFRGKRIDGKGWAYGYYFVDEFYHSLTSHRIFTELHENIAVYPETIGQFTGLCDKNGKEIYEGDRTGGDEVLVFFDGVFGTTYKGNQQGVSMLSEKRCKYLQITGNIHEK